MLRVWAEAPAGTEGLEGSVEARWDLNEAAWVDKVIIDKGGLAF